MTTAAEPVSKHHGDRLTVVEPPSRWPSFELRELWSYRELLFFLLWRDIKVRYKQTALGPAWALVQPVVQVIIFTVIFGRLANIPSEGVPYPLFAYAGLLPWTYFSTAVGLTGASILSSSSLITKVYFPRLLIPAGSALVPLADFLLASTVLVGLFVWYGIGPSWQMIAVPALLLLALLTALGSGLWLSALTVRFRDVRFATPFLLQIWMYLSPVVYPVSIVPEKWRWVFSLNPMVGVLDGFRWALLDRAAPAASVLATSAVAGVVLAVSGAAYFKRTERRFADII